MTEPVPQSDVVPDKVLEELLVAFAPEAAPESYDFDDPSIDRLLGVSPAEGGTRPGLAGTGEGPSPPVPPAPGGSAAQVEADAETVPDKRDAATPGGDEVPEPPATTGGLEAPASPQRDRRQGRRARRRERRAARAAGAAPAPAVERPAPGEGAVRTIVIGVDDDVDIPYLDEAVGGVAPSNPSTAPSAPDRSEGRDRSTIVIDLDDAPVEQIPARSSPSSMDPRLRARRIAVRRAEGRRRLLWVAVAAGALLLVVGVVAVFASPLFDVTDVRVQGAVYTDPQELQAVVDDIRGDPILLVDTEAAERRLESIPWVERAHVRTHFPHTVTIDIREREPVAAFAGIDGRFRVIDRDARVIAILDGIPVDYPTIEGLNPDTGLGQFAGPIYRSAAQLVLALPDEIRALEPTIGVDATSQTLTMQLDGGLEVRLGEPEDLTLKLARLLTVIRDPRPGMTRIDVSTGELSIT